MTMNNNIRDFEAALAEVCERVRRGEPLEDCLADYPAAYRDELRQLVPLTGRVASVGADPSLLFRARLEQRLIGAVEAQRAAEATGWRSWFAPAPALRAAGVAFVLLLVLGGSGIGVTYAAEPSLPDSPLYPVKRARERIELALARDDEAASVTLARQAERREDEIERAVEGDKRQVMETLAREAVATAQRWVVRAERAAAEGNLRPAIQGREAVRNLIKRVDTKMATAGPDAKGTLQRLRRILEQQEERLSALLPAGRDAPRTQPAPARPTPSLTR
jgi:uncharacterized protein DUF5667